MISPTDLTGIDEDLARRVLAIARSIAPCLDSLVDGTGDVPKPKSDAIAILKGVAREIPAPGSSRVRSQRVGPAQVEYSNPSTWFSSDDRAALSSLCASATYSGRDPIGSFPLPGPTSTVWPEIYPN